jgi:hypothetical protein
MAVASSKSSSSFFRLAFGKGGSVGIEAGCGTTRKCLAGRGNSHSCSVKSRGSSFSAKLGSDKGKNDVVPRFNRRTKEGPRRPKNWTLPKFVAGQILGQKPRGLDLGSPGKIAVQFCSTVEATSLNHTLIQFGLPSKGFLSRLIA